MLPHHTATPLPPLRQTRFTTASAPGFEQCHFAMVAQRVPRQPHNGEGNLTEARHLLSSLKVRLFQQQIITVSSQQQSPACSLKNWAGPPSWNGLFTCHGAFGKAGCRQDLSASPSLPLAITYTDTAPLPARLRVPSGTESEETDWLCWKRNSLAWWGAAVTRT